MVGIPGSGKSSLAKYWLETGQVDSIISSDDLREKLTGAADNFTQEVHVWRTFYTAIENELNGGFRVVADATHVTPRTWAKISEVATKYNLVPQAHIMRTEHRVSSVRNAARTRRVPDDVMMRMAGNFDGNVSRRTLYLQGFEVFEYYEEDLPTGE